MKLASVLATFVSASTVALVACSSDSSSSGTAGSASTGALSSAYCNYLAKCAQQELQLTYGDTATCTSSFSEVENQIFSLPGVNATTAAIEACTSKVNALSCTQTPDDVAECTFTGTLAAGAACAQDSQCASSFCKRAQASATTSSSGGSAASANGGVDCGHCADRSDVGGPCDGEGGCKTGLACDYLASKCAPKPARGAPCKPGGAACADNLRCVSGVCADALAAGAACNATEDACADLLECVNGKCSDAGAHFATAQLGQACGVDVASQKLTVCVASSCAGAQGQQKCVPFAKVGEDCDTGTTDGASTKPSCGVLLTCDPATKKCKKVDFTVCK